MYAAKSDKSMANPEKVDHSKMSKAEHAAYLKENAPKKKRTVVMKRKSREAY